MLRLEAALAADSSVKASRSAWRRGSSALKRAAGRIGARHRYSRHHRRDGAVRWPVRHRVGHHGHLYRHLEAQTTNLAVVAPGIAEALLATAIGLVAAIPAVVIYNILRATSRLPRADRRCLGAVLLLSAAISTGASGRAARAGGVDMARELGFASMTHGGEDDLDEVHEINVTPFIDVMLVLLIIFMVAAPLATVDLAVDLPVSREPQPRRQADLPDAEGRPSLASARAGVARIRWPALDAATRATRNSASSCAPTSTSTTAS